MAYPFKPGFEEGRLRIIWEIYSWCGMQPTGNRNREACITWDIAQMFGAIAGGYVIELSPHYKGVQLVKRNKPLWEKVSTFVKLKVGQACLPYDSGGNGEKWEHLNNTSFFELEEKNV